MSPGFSGRSGVAFGGGFLGQRNWQPAALGSHRPCNFAASARIPVRDLPEARTGALTGLRVPFLLFRPILRTKAPACAFTGVLWLGVAFALRRRPMEVRPAQAVAPENGHPARWICPPLGARPSSPTRSGRGQAPSRTSPSSPCNRLTFAANPAADAGGQSQAGARAQGVHFIVLEPKLG